MKQSHAYFNDLTFGMDESELEAAEILQDLPRLIIKSQSVSGFPFTWGAKRKRSSPADSPSLPEAVVAVAPTCETEKSKALSPATPLLFSPSESDEKSKHNSRRRKVSFERKKDEYFRIEKELTERNNIFKEEIKNLKRYFDQQKALNLKLKTMKAMKDRMILGLQMEQPQPKLSLNHAMELAHPSPRFDNQDYHQRTQCMVHQQPFIIDWTAQNCDSSPYPHVQNLSLLSSNGGLLMINNDNAGPSVVPDLNLSSEESFMIMESGQALNLGIADKSQTRALAARARQRRIQICRSKNPTAANKLRYPICR